MTRILLQPISIGRGFSGWTPLSVTEMVPRGITCSVRVKEENMSKELVEGRVVVMEGYREGVHLLLAQKKFAPSDFGLAFEAFTKAVDGSTVGEVLKEIAPHENEVGSLVRNSLMPCEWHHVTEDFVMRVNNAAHEMRGDEWFAGLFIQNQMAGYGATLAYFGHGATSVTLEVGPERLVLKFWVDPQDLAGFHSQMSCCQYGTSINPWWRVEQAGIEPDSHISAREIFKSLPAEIRSDEEEIRVQGLLQDDVIVLKKKEVVEERFCIEE